MVQRQKDCDPRFVVEIIRRMATARARFRILPWVPGTGRRSGGLNWNEFADQIAANWNQNVTYNGYPKHHGAEDSGQIELLFNSMYNRDCMIHHCTNVTNSGAPYEVSKNVMEHFFGEGCWDPAKHYTLINENKIKVAKWSFFGKQIHDSLTVCNWMWPMTQSPAKDRNYIGDIDLEAKFMTAVTGIEYTRESLEKDAEQISNMLRCMTAISFHKELGSTNLRVDHDAIPAWIFDKDPDLKAFDAGTVKMDRDDMEKAKDMWYTALGWDVATGIPTKAKLHELEKHSTAGL